jgi:hypothetical protein
MMNKSILVFYFFFVIFNKPLFGQIKRPSYTIETGASGSAGKQTPFWLISNQYDLLTPNKFNSWLKLGFHSKLDSSKKIDYDYGFDLVNRYSNQYDLYIHQGYARLKLWFINVQAGSIEEKFGDQDNSLSSGGLLWSGNARPMPKVTINVPKYTAVPFTKGFLEFKGGISHGWFGNNQFVKNTWLHHKYVYIQLGGKLPVHIHYGYHHFAQWGGESRDTTIGNLPSGFKDFMKVFFAKSGSSTAPLSETINRLGNHIGSRNFGLDVDLKKIRVGIYYQNVFEDNSGKHYHNKNDGLWGFYLHTNDKNKPVSGIVYEYVNTTDQSGSYNDYWMLNGVRYLYPVAGGEHFEAGGNDDYFNNFTYLMGWTLHDMTIGTPLITSPAIFSVTSPDYIRNNKIQAHHIGIEGTYKKLYYKLFYTYSLNYGTNLYPFNGKKDQQSIMLNMQLSNSLPWGLIFATTIGVDKCKMYGNNAGILISLIKKGMF